MNDKKKGFMMYRDMHNDISDLTTEQKGILLDCIFYYQNDYEWKSEDQFVNFIMKQYIKIFERDRLKYEKTCLKRKEAVKKRWAKQNEPTTKQIELAKAKGIDYTNMNKNQLAVAIEKQIKNKDNLYQVPNFEELETPTTMSADDIDDLLKEKK